MKVLCVFIAEINLILQFQIIAFKIQLSESKKKTRECIK
jgi:hypothetical protein